MVNKEYVLSVDTKDAIAHLQQLGMSLDEAKDKLKELQEEEKKTAKEAEDAARAQADMTRDGLQGIDAMSGGYINMAKDMVNSFKLISAQTVSFFKKFIVGAKGGNTAMKGLRGAILATGIGALVVAVGALVAYWDDIKNAIFGASSATNEMAESTAKRAAAEKDTLDRISASENILREQGKTEEEITAMKEEQMKVAINAGKAEIQALKIKKKEEIASYNRQRAFVKGALQVLNAVPLAIATALDAIINALPEGLREFMGIGTSDMAGSINRAFDSIGEKLLGSAEEYTEETNDALKTAENNLLGLENNLAGSRLKRKEEAKKRAEDAKKKRDDEKQSERDAQAELAETQRRYAEQKEKDAEMAATQKYNNDLERMQLAMSKELNAIGLTEDAKQAIRDKYAVERKIREDQYYDELDKLADEKNTKALEKQKAAQEAQAKTDEDAKAKAKEREQTLADFKAELQSNLFSTLYTLNSVYDKNNKDAARKAFNREKALNMAETLLTTYQSAMKAYSSQLIPNDPTSPIRAGILAASVVAMGLAKVRSIAATKFDGGETQPSSSNSGSAPSTSGGAPSFNIVGQSGVNQLMQGISQKLSQPTRAYVVDKDISTAQSLERNRVRTATIG
jgi:hypothetical protein